MFAEFEVRDICCLHLAQFITSELVSTFVRIAPATLACAVIASAGALRDLVGSLRAQGALEELVQAAQDIVGIQSAVFATLVHLKFRKRLAPTMNASLVIIAIARFSYCEIAGLMVSLIRPVKSFLSKVITKNSRSTFAHCARKRLQTQIPPARFHHRQLQGGAEIDQDHVIASDCEEFFTALFSRHLGLGRPCETVRTALAHAEDIYEGLSGILKKYDPNVVKGAFVRILDKHHPEMAPLSPRSDSETAAAASASATRIPVGPLPPPLDD